jgi:hypothetical protein
MLETLNLDRLKGINMSQVKTMGDSALKGIKGINMSQVKSFGDTALKGISKLSKKRMKVAGYSVNPLLLGGAAALALGSYLIYRSLSGRTNQSLAGAGMRDQVHPIK